MTTIRQDGSERVPVYILAGGKSRRFGRDKARELRGGLPLISKVAAKCRPIAASTTVVARRPGQYDDLGLRTIGDVVPGKGPIGGLRTAIQHCEAGGWIFLVACDWVGIREKWLRLLTARLDEARQAVVFRASLIEPLFGFYHTSIHGIVARRIDNGALAMHDLLDEIDTLVVPAPDDWSGAVNYNEPDPETR